MEIWEWISNFISHFAMDVITYTCWDSSKYVLVEGAPELCWWCKQAVEQTVKLPVICKRLSASGCMGLSSSGSFH